MAVKTEKELNEAERSLWLKAMAAIELRNFGYAISLLQGILKQEPQFLTGRQLLREFGLLYHKTSQSDEEVEIYNRITEIDPLDAAALRLGKDASARASMATGGWTQAESYRELIKDKDVAISLEQQSRMQLSGEARDRQIDELEAQEQ